MKARWLPVLSGALFLSMAATGQAQAPTKAQQDAIRSNCRSDFLSLCSGVPRGGREAFECLTKNQSRLSGGCRSAVSAVVPPAAPPAAARPEPKPEPRAAKPEPAPPSAPAASAPAAPSPAAAAPAAPAPQTPAAKKPAPPKKTAAPARPPAPAVPPPTAAPVPAVVTPPPPATHQPRLGEAILIRRFCTTDFRVLCKGVPLGQGRAVQCLASNAAALSPGCRQAMVQTGELQP